MKNLPAELQKEREEKQKQDKGVNIVTEGKEQGKEQNKTIPQGYNSSISPPKSHVESLNKSRESEQQSGRSK